MPWLMLKRHIGEGVQIGTDINLKVIAIDENGGVLIGFDAPVEMVIARHELIYPNLSKEVWGETNRRRGLLVKKRNAGEATVDELKELQEICDQSLAALGRWRKNARKESEDDAHQSPSRTV
jgi:carbon storage regulator CsrA